MEAAAVLVDMDDVFRWFWQRLIKVEGSLTRSCRSQRRRVRIQSEMAEVPLHRVTFHHRGNWDQVTAATLALCDIDLEDLGEHFAPRIVFEAALFLLFPELKSLLDLGLQCNFSAKG